MVHSAGKRLDAIQAKPRHSQALVPERTVYEQIYGPPSASQSIGGYGRKLTQGVPILLGKLSGSRRQQQ
jgi:hypothetical protein